MCLIKESQKQKIINKNLEILISSVNDGFNDLDYVDTYISRLNGYKHDEIKKKIRLLKTLIKKKNKKKILITTHKCLARVWNNGLGGQCSRKQKCNGFCLGHWKKLQAGNLPHGRIDVVNNNKFSDLNRIVDGKMISYFGKYYILDMATQNVYSYLGNNNFVGILKDSMIDFNETNPFQEYESDDSDLE